MQYSFMKNTARFVTMPLEEAPMLYYTEVGLSHLEVPNVSAMFQQQTNECSKKCRASI